MGAFASCFSSSCKHDPTAVIPPQCLSSLSPPRLSRQSMTLRQSPSSGTAQDLEGAFVPYDYKTPLFSLMDDEGKRRPARLVGCHDGDTISVVIKQESKAARFNVRLDGIDTPEMTSVVKDLAIAARNRLIYILTRGCVTLPTDGEKLTRTDINVKLCEQVHVLFLECRGMDKYGRVLAKIYLEESPYFSKSANQILLDEGHAKPYSGGTKEVSSVR